MNVKALSATATPHATSDARGSAHTVQVYPWSRKVNPKIRYKLSR